jgi:acetaldehyde dehydrogenase (acetylating)
VKDWREACERCKSILRYGGMGHTMSIHSQNDAVILEFGLHKPAYRICVNTPTTHGSIGLTTGLDPAMTLGCGGFGGTITSDNITPRHLINVKRVAYELRAVPRVPNVPEVPKASFSNAVPSSPALPKAPSKPQPDSIPADALTSRIDRFLATRGLAPASPVSPASAASPASPASPAVPEQFVCEDDVRQAVKLGKKIMIGERTIITPAARDAGDAANVFLHAGWPSS